MHIKTLKKTPLAMAIIVSCSTLPAVADDTFTEALKTGKASVNARLRYEQVDDDAFKDVANGLTLRTRAGYETAPFYGFTALSEFEDIRVVGGVDDYQLPPPPAFNTKESGIIADAEMTELNRIQIRYRGVPKLDMVLGRQRLLFDNQRFIGNVGFRQDEQTYDAFSAVYTGAPDFIFSYAYVDAVNGFSSTSDDSTTGVFDADTSDNLINISYNGFVWGKFVLYSYNLHNQNDTLRGPAANININPGLRYISNETTGLRLDGAYVLPTTVTLKAIYRAEYARQTAVQMEGAVAPTVEKSHDADYNLLEAGMALTFGGGKYTFTPLLGYELLGSDKGTYGLQTPYATKHAFNGWVDQFLVTPKEGLQDVYATFGFDFNNASVKTLLSYHEYNSDEANLSTKKAIDFGSETSLQVIKTIGANWIVGGKGAAYDIDEKDAKTSGASKKDARKMWVWAEFNF